MLSFESFLSISAKKIFRICMLCARMRRSKCTRGPNLRDNSIQANERLFTLATGDNPFSMDLCTEK